MYLDNKYIIFSSVTLCLKGMSALKRAGIASRPEKFKNLPSVGGCGYALAVRGELLADAVLIIENEGLKISDIIEGGYPLS